MSNLQADALTVAIVWAAYLAIEFVSWLVCEYWPRRDRYFWE